MNSLLDIQLAEETPQVLNPDGLLVRPKKQGWLYEVPEPHPLARQGHPFSPRVERIKAVLPGVLVEALQQGTSLAEFHWGLKLKSPPDTAALTSKIREVHLACPLTSCPRKLGRVHQHTHNSVLQSAGKPGPNRPAVFGAFRHQSPEAFSASQQQDQACSSCYTVLH